jgi:hypothetical protein
VTTHLQQFPTIAFEVQAICVHNIFDLVGTNVLATYWTRRMVNRDEFEHYGSGVSVITGRLGKVIQVEDSLLDLGVGFRRMWGAAQPSRPSGGRRHCR